MKSPNEARPKSTPKKITLEGGIKINAPMASGRVTPVKKTEAKLCNDCCR
jgi:hypothetical protein